MTKTINTQLDGLQDRAEWFAKEFADATYEMGQAQNFMRGLCDVYGISPYRAVVFEQRVKKDDDKGINRIDGLFPGLLLVEMKSSGKNLEKAYTQATGYVEKLKKSQQKPPRYVLVSDLQNLTLYDQESATPDAPIADFKTADFRLNVETLSFLCGYERIAIQQQEQANALAAEKLANLHDAIKDTGYTGKELEALLVRILFCLFADDTGLFGEADLFAKVIANTRSDGRDLSGTLDTLFITLDTDDGKNTGKPNQRSKSIYPEFIPFPYVNGELFKGRLAPCPFDSAARAALIDCSNIDWSQISPDIFGSLFQAIMHFDDEAGKAKTKKRREFGAHYTSEKNILKVIGPLFLDDLKTELKKIRKDAKKLNTYLAKLRQFNFFDPACGCGNFLVVTYRELRLLEEEALQRLALIPGQTSRLPECDVDQFHGIEIDLAAAQIATIALWLTDHQMNRRVQLGDKPYNRLPLKAKANIVCDNALRLDWPEVLTANKCSFVMGNPPFIGAKFMSQSQRDDIEPILKPLKNGGLLDYVAAWYVKAAQYIQNNPAVPVAFVSTNSITQGEQVGALWDWMLIQNIKISFAHRTFRWNNEGRGVAAVHCVIVGFGLSKPKHGTIYDYSDIGGEPEAIKAKNINPYLVDAPNVMISNRKKSLCAVPEMRFGNQPIDGGQFILSEEERADFLKYEPGVEKFIRVFLGADEFINSIPRYCLWLNDINISELKNFPLVIQRVQAVKDFRLKSSREATNKLAATPTQFAFVSHQNSNYLLLPSVSSERRNFIPIGFMPPEVIASNLCLIIPNATLFHFGILTSTMHNAWMRTVCGRMKSDYRYSVGIVYNNYPWPNSDEAHIKTISDKSQAILDARALHDGKSLAWLYNPETMPDNLSQAHAELDKAVDAAYGYKGKKDDAARVAFLFSLYQRLVSDK